MKAVKTTKEYILQDIEELDERGNIVPEQLKKIIINKNGKTNKTALDIYVDLRNWYKPKKVFGRGNKVTYERKLDQDILQLGYDYLKEKFDCSKETVRRNFVLLEELGLIKREFKKTICKGRVVDNVLYIKVFKQTPHFISDIGLDNPLFVSSSSEDCDHQASKALTEPTKMWFDDHTDRGLYIDDNNNNNNISRSEILNSINILEVKEEAIALPEPETPEPVASFEKEMEPEKEVAVSTAPNLEQVPADQSQRQCRPKSINHCLELSEQDFESLRSSSKRKFNNNAIKQLLKHLAVKKPDLIFYNNKASLVYFSKFLAHEKMSERICNMPGFVRVGYNSNSRSARVERFIEKLETTCQRDASKEDLFTKLLAETLQAELVYDLCKDSRIIVEGENLCFYLKTSTKINLTDDNKAEILNVANSIFCPMQIENQIVDVVCYYAKTKSSEEQDIANTKRENVVEKIQQLPGLTKGWERTLLDLALVSESFNVDPETVLQDFAQCELDEENTDKLYCTTNSPEHAQRLTQTYERYFKNIVCGHYGKKILISSFDDQGALRKFAEIESSGVVLKWI